MLAEFVLVSFAAFIGWQIFISLKFFDVNYRVAPLLVFAIAFSLTFLLQPSFLIGLAATGGVALLNKITEATSPVPWKFPRIIPKKKDKWPETGLPPRQGVGHRIPQL